MAGLNIRHNRKLDAMRPTVLEQYLWTLHLYGHHLMTAPLSVYIRQHPPRHLGIKAFPVSM
jgi:hypothetical protein